MSFPWETVRKLKIMPISLTTLFNNLRISCKLNKTSNLLLRSLTMMTMGSITSIKDSTTSSHARYSLYWEINFYWLKWLSQALLCFRLGKTIGSSLVSMIPLVSWPASYGWTTQLVLEVVVIKPADRMISELGSLRKRLVLAQSWLS